MFFKSIFSRLFCTYAVIALVALSIVGATFTSFLYNYTENTQVDNIMQLASTIEQMTGVFQIEENDIRARNAYRYQLSNLGNLVHADIIVVNSVGEITENTSNKVTNVPNDMLDTALNGKMVRELGDFNGQYDKQKVLTIALPISYNGNIVGVMFFNSMLPKMRETFFEMAKWFVIVLLISLAVACVLGYMQSKRLSKPIQDINKAVRDMAAGNFTKRVEVNSRDEIGQLASSFNFMAHSLEELEDQRSRFVSDVSHELRTPMTSISGFVQSILNGAIPKDEEEYYLKIVLEESQRLTKLVNDMLEMTKMSSSEYQLTIEKFDINELIRICIIGMTNKIEERNLDLNFDCKPEKINVLADKDSIKRVVINLLDNAVKFSYPNTTMSVRTWISDGKAHICVGNFGDGIEGADMANIFNRFYKTDKSRSKEKSGAGLGLSFVKNILVLHKQSIWVESVDAKEGSDAKFTKFTFTLELA